MRIEVNTDLYKVFRLMVVFMATNGDKDAPHFVNKNCNGWIDEAMENYLVKFFNDNGDLYSNWNKLYKRIEKQYKKYKDEELKAILNK